MIDHVDSKGSVLKLTQTDILGFLYGFGEYHQDGEAF